MTDLVDPCVIERTVGARRHQHAHLGRYIAIEGMIYILHSQECLDGGADLRECKFVALDRWDWWSVRNSLALADRWDQLADRPVVLALSRGGMLAPKRDWGPAHWHRDKSGLAIYMPGRKSACRDCAGVVV